MKTILLFGAGKSATVLINYLLDNAQAQGWFLNVVDANLELAKSKLKGSPAAEAFSFDINDDLHRVEMIHKADLVISMLPPHLHFSVARDCARLGKHLLTASYLDDNIKSLSEKVKEKNILFLCEMGLDPGIDHMSAMKIIHEIKKDGGIIHSFKSHCGGLIAPESDDNPWHYKVSWNPRNILLAGKAGAHFREHGAEIKLNYQELFSRIRKVSIPDHEELAWYPNRDSLAYFNEYGLHETDTFIRTTLRHPDFIEGWNVIIDLHLTDEVKKFDTDGKSLAAFFREHLSNMGLAKMHSQSPAHSFEEQLENWLDNSKGLNKANTKIILNQLRHLGLNDHQTLINKGLCSAADVMEFILQNKLDLKDSDKDMIVMLHEIGYEKAGSHFEIKSYLKVKGDDHLNTAMAKTVGLPLGIAAKLILNGTIQRRGICIPVDEEIYHPVLAELETLGISFTESKTRIS